ncbi:hypothetical protein MA16_Dca013312 [Dendrobium catenatum]|uniref:Uncharacterized protein n=1 Tax=Dendrobium catenatum TaxID=906689 RepID=A0A2I0WDJ9_9ASPA|nr:hypothetical protein MA16_Dca013312 [Dendrobium catenatum]
MSADSWMTERAKEELKSLEARHPSRFDYLKLELQSLISDYDLNPSFPDLISSSSPGTQGPFSLPLSAPIEAVFILF